jgi:hypothetical protein
MASRRVFVKVDSETELWKAVLSNLICGSQVNGYERFRVRIVFDCAVRVRKINPRNVGNPDEKLSSLFLRPPLRRLTFTAEAPQR